MLKNKNFVMLLLFIMLMPVTLLGQESGGGLDEPNSYGSHLLQDRYMRDTLYKLKISGEYMPNTDTYNGNAKDPFYPAQTEDRLLLHMNWQLAGLNINVHNFETNSGSVGILEFAPVIDLHLLSGMPGGFSSIGYRGGGATLYLVNLVNFHGNDSGKQWQIKIINAGVGANFNRTVVGPSGTTGQDFGSESSGVTVQAADIEFDWNRGWFELSLDSDLTGNFLSQKYYIPNVSKDAVLSAVQSIGEIVARLHFAALISPLPFDAFSIKAGGEVGGMVASPVGDIQTLDGQPSNQNVAIEYGGYAGVVVKIQTAVGSFIVSFGKTITNNVANVANMQRLPTYYVRAKLLF